MNKYFVFLLICVSAVCAFGTGEYKRSWYLSESQILAMLGGQEHPIHVALFSPRQGREIKELLVGLIANEQKSIRCATFFLSNKHVMYAFKQAMDRGIFVQLIISQESTKNRTVWEMPYIQVCRVADGLMHHKFVVFEDTVAHKKLLWTGSFNLTNQAVNHNRENVVVLEDERLIELYKDEFESVKIYSCSLFSQQAFDSLSQVSRNFEESKHYIDREQLRAAVQKSLARQQFVVAQPITDLLNEREAGWLYVGEDWWKSCVDWTQSTVHYVFG